jgi:hypothetical protein
VLDGVLGLLAVAEHVTAEREDATMVALVELFERGLAAGPDEGDQSLVRRDPQDGSRDPWAAVCGRVAWKG